MNALAEIRNLRPDILGVFVTLGCPKCAHGWEAYQPTSLGISLSTHQCPNCSAKSLVTSESFGRALDRFWPEPSREEIVALTNEASRVTQDWHRNEIFANALNYKGVNLGEASERYLVSHVTLGLGLPNGPEASS
jgi:lambda repressor-like predicted transcriptional regulator